MKDKMKNIFDTWLAEETEDFSGVLSATGCGGIIHQQAIGCRDFAQDLPNTTDTAFGIASGTKLFTGLAVCKLIDNGKLSLDAKLCDLLPHDLGVIDKRVTVYQLLTHTSGVGDYVDEDAEDFYEQYAAMMAQYPAREWERLDYYLQMITPLPPKFAPGERFCYSNSGYVLLGLVIEAVNGIPFQQYVTDEIIRPCGLAHTGFYRADALPDNTAIGYKQDDDDEWTPNTHNLPIIGGSDGGIFSCAADIDKLWRAIFAHKILSPAMTDNFLKQHIITETDEEEGTTEGYGLGVYRNEDDGKTFYFAIGADAGVGFFTGYYPATQTVVSAFCNTGYNGASLLFDDLPDLLG
ncbi:MAG: beta-lactamase family protein [Defluviitaleaceae bacterium]|nr:beta-lactamase family protein [Defluviitaleaceae bacterium]